VVSAPACRKESSRFKSLPDSLGGWDNGEALPNKLRVRYHISKQKYAKILLLVNFQMKSCLWSLWHFDLDLFYGALPKKCYEKVRISICPVYQNLSLSSSQASLSFTFTKIPNVKLPRILSIQCEWHCQRTSCKLPLIFVVIHWTSASQEKQRLFILKVQWRLFNYW
jgi:hypothetical protein